MNRARWCIYLSLGALLCMAGSASATVLIMDGEASNSSNNDPPPAGGNSYGPMSNGFTIVSEYGDNVAGPLQSDVPTADFGTPPFWYNHFYSNNGEGYTPNVVVGKQVIYSNVTNTATRYWSAAGDRTDVAYPSASYDLGGKWYWTFTADPNYLVNLIATDFVRFNSTTFTATVNVYSGDNPMSLGPLLYSSGPLAVNNVAQTISPNVRGSALTLEFDIPAGDALFNWAADNIVFGQSAVPEPCGLILFAFGVVSMLSIWRKSR